MLDHRVASLGIFAAAYILISLYLNGLTKRLKHIPTAGYTVPLFMFPLVQWPTTPFKVPSFLEWTVIATQPIQIEDICKAPKNVLSGMIAIENALRTRFTLGPHITKNPYHIPVIRSQLIHSLPLLVPEVHAELIEACTENIPSTTVKALDSVLKVMSWASNRVFVGIPLCKDPEWNKLSMQFTVGVVQTANILRFLPVFLRPLVNKFISKVESRAEKALNMLRSSIAERRLQRQEKGSDDGGKQGDLLSWLMDAVKGEEKEDWYLTSRLLTVQFSAIHTSSTAFTQALYYLALYPEHIEPFREEVEEVTFREGWTKVALDQMS